MTLDYSPENPDSIPRKLKAKKNSTYMNIFHNDYIIFLNGAANYIVSHSKPFIF